MTAHVHAHGASSPCKQLGSIGWHGCLESGVKTIYGMKPLLYQEPLLANKQAAIYHSFQFAAIVAPFLVDINSSIATA